MQKEVLQCCLLVPWLFHYIALAFPLQRLLPFTPSLWVCSLRAKFLAQCLLPPWGHSNCLWGPLDPIGPGLCFASLWFAVICLVQGTLLVSQLTAPALQALGRVHPEVPCGILPPNQSFYPYSTMGVGSQWHQGDAAPHIKLEKQSVSCSRDASVLRNAQHAGRAPKKLPRCRTRREKLKAAPSHVEISPEGRLARLKRGRLERGCIAAVRRHRTAEVLPCLAVPGGSEPSSSPALCRALTHGAGMRRAGGPGAAPRLRSSQPRG